MRRVVGEVADKKRLLSRTLGENRGKTGIELWNVCLLWRGGGCRVNDWFRGSSSDSFSVIQHYQIC